MAVVALKLKLMPSSPDVDLEQIKKDAEAKLKELGAISINQIEEEPIAFGLKAIIITLAWPEEKDNDIVENELAKVENVSSVQILDYRRAIG